MKSVNTITPSLSAGLLVVLLTACAGPATQRVAVDPQAAAREAELQRELFLRTNQKDQNRVQDLAFPLLTHAVSLCGEDVRPAMGFLPLNRNAWPKDYQAAAASVLGVDERLAVLHVVPASPAATAGFLPGDVLLSIGSDEIPAGDKAAEHFEKIARKNLAVGTATQFAVDRGGTTTVLDLTPVAACDYLVALVPNDQVNAFADGQNIYITTGMLRFTESDAEISTVLAHELAHNAMGHIDKKKGNFLLGSIFDVVAAVYGVNTQGFFGGTAAKAFSQDFEAEADYVGMYALALTGGSVQDAPGFWRRMGANNPGSIKTSYSGTHPGSADRYLALDGTITEIQSKAASGAPLVPTLAKDK